MKNLHCLLTAFFIIPLLSAAASAQQQEQELPEEARKRLEHAVGKWQVISKSYNREGEVVRETKGIDTNRFIVAGRVIEHTIGSEAGETTAQGHMFYNFRTEQFCITSVDKNGDLWILSGDLDKYVMTSRKREQPDGSVMVIRFTHENIQPDSFEAQMEISRDGGETWRKGYRQFITRLKDDTAK